METYSEFTLQVRQRQAQLRAAYATEPASAAVIDVRVNRRTRQPDTHPLRLRQLARTAEPSCVVLQTLRGGVPVDVELDLLGADPRT